jgi:uncharacterized protein (DUF849 family)
MAESNAGSMGTPGKVIISSAITGSVYTPSMSPHLPVTLDEIAGEAIAAAEARATIAHLHAYNLDSGKPARMLEAFAPFVKRIRLATRAVINITTGGSAYMRLEERVLPAATLKPELASLNMGSMNFGPFHMLVIRCQRMIPVDWLNRSTNYLIRWSD